MLHIVGKSPFNRTAFCSCVEHLNEDQGLLLIEDGVYAVVKDSKFHCRVENALQIAKVYALKPDVEARGLQERLIDGITLVDYGGFVDLATEYSVVQTWL